MYTVTIVVNVVNVYIILLPPFNYGTTKSLHWRPIGDHFFDEMVAIWRPF